MKALKLKIPPLAQVLIAATVMYLVALFFPAFSFELPFSGHIATAFAFSGASIALAGVASFRRAGTTVNPLAPDAASSLVVSGIYRYTRNPMYLGMLAVLTGWWCYLHNLMATPLLPLFVYAMNRLQIEPEEEILKQMFPEQYPLYTQQVGRWFGFKSAPSLH